MNVLRAEVVHYFEWSTAGHVICYYDCYLDLIICLGRFWFCFHNPGTSLTLSIFVKSNLQNRKQMTWYDQYVVLFTPLEWSPKSVRGKLLG